MSNPKAIEASRHRKRRALERVFDRYVVDEPFVTTDTELTDRVGGGVVKQDIRNLRYDLEGLDPPALRTRAVYGPGKAPTRKVEWTLLSPKTVALARLEAKWKADDAHTAELMRQPNPSKGRKKAATAPTANTGWSNGAGQLNTGDATPDHPVVPDELVASSGPQAPKPLAPLAPARHDEPRALVEAARQYAAVNNQLDSKVKELEALGVTVDRVQLAKAIKAPHDHVLLVVSKVLPYVEQLERQVDRLTTQVTDQREKLTGLPELQHRVNRLSEQNQRLVSENTGLRDRLAQRGDLAGRVPDKPRQGAGPKVPAPVG
jgi:hypothetical protein